jgi:hypothetical protein
MPSLNISKALTLTRMKMWGKKTFFEYLVLNLVKMYMC